MGSTQSVQLNRNGEGMSGRANYECTRISWQNGSCWVKEEPVSRDLEFSSEQANLLSDKQLNVVIDKVNEKLDIWLLSEKAERKLIAVPATQLNEKLGDALASFLHPEMVTALKVLLDDTKEVDAKEAEIQSALKNTLRDPVAKALNDKINLPIIGEDLEQQVFDMIVDSIIQQMVEQTVAGLEKTGFV